jgi:hypothetical protein
MTPQIHPRPDRLPPLRGMFSPAPRRSPWLWCLVCERAFPRESGRRGIQPCPYEDCKDRAGFYAWDWNRTRRIHPEYPEVPRFGERYPLLED